MLKLRHLENGKATHYGRLKRLKSLVNTLPFYHYDNVLTLLSIHTMAQW